MNKILTIEKLCKDEYKALRDLLQEITGCVLSDTILKEFSDSIDGGKWKF